MKKNIILIGMPGSGKTSSGKALAKKKNMLFVDSDSRFEQRFGKISDFFDNYGEAAFRVEEGRILYELSRLSGAVISCGGGAVINPAFSYLASSGAVILLFAQAETLYDRLKDDTSRPLLKGDPKKKIEQLLKERTPLYKRYAHATVITDGLSVEQTASAVDRASAPILTAMNKPEEDE